MLGLALSNRYLIAQLVKRELALKYTGSVLGGLWVVVTPLIMLAIYSLFFTVVIKAKWGDAGFESDAFALLLFAGLLLHSFFAEILTSTPQLVVSNPNYVKKTVFPVEVLAIVQTLTAALGLAVNLALLLLFVTIFQGLPGPEALFSIVILLPLLLMALGTAWMLSAMGVFFRDISQITGLLAAALLFTSPIFYPVSALSERAQNFLYLNPLTFLIEQLRLVVFAGVLPNFIGLGLFIMGAALFSYLCYSLFMRVKVGFADVL
jgi:lipopolysaccharide transport system permease protein